MLSEYLKKQRIKNCFTQEHVARELGITKPYYCQLENGKIPGIVTIGKIATFYNVKPSYIRRLIDEDNK
jgi:transcriptional regulator with XRE-family HTH domain